MIKYDCMLYIKIYMLYNLKLLNKDYKIVIIHFLLLIHELIPQLALLAQALVEKLDTLPSFLKIYYA